MLGHRHQRGQGDTLARALGDEARAQAVAPEIPREPRECRAPLHDGPDRRRRQRSADPLLPEAPKDRAFGEPTRIEPSTQGNRRIA